MKINVPFFSVLALAVGFSIISCASEPAESTEKSIVNEEIVKEPKVQNFEDWQYKGFGKEIPESAEQIFAWINSNSVVEDEIIVEGNTLIVFGRGTNSDHCINVLENRIEKQLVKYKETHEMKEFSQVEDYWIKVNQEVWETDRPYMAIRVFEIN